MIVYIPVYSLVYILVHTNVKECEVLKENMQELTNIYYEYLDSLKTRRKREGGRERERDWMGRWLVEGERNTRCVCERERESSRHGRV